MSKVLAGGRTSSHSPSRENPALFSLAALVTSTAIFMFLCSYFKQAIRNAYNTLPENNWDISLW